MTVGERVADWKARQLNYTFLGWIAVVVGLPIVLVATGVAEAPYVSMIFGFLAAAGLVYRLISTWHLTSVLTHGLAIALVATLLLSSVGAAQAIRQDAYIVTIVMWPIIILRMVIVLIAIKWNRWIGRNWSPFLQEPPRTPGRHVGHVVDSSPWD